MSTLNSLARQSVDSEPAVVLVAAMVFVGALPCQVTLSMCSYDTQQKRSRCFCNEGFTGGGCGATVTEDKEQQVVLLKEHWADLCRITVRSSASWLSS